MDVFKKSWDGEIFFNNGEGKMGRGVAILIRKNKGIEGELIYDDKKGKCIGVRIKYGNEEFNLINLHAPNEEKEKSLFFNDLRELIEGWGK